MKQLRVCIPLLSLLIFSLLQSVPAVVSVHAQATYPVTFAEQRRRMEDLRKDFKRYVDEYINRYNGYSFSSLMSLGDPKLLHGYVPAEGGGEENEIFLIDGSYRYFRGLLGCRTAPMSTETNASQFISGSVAVWNERQGCVDTSNSFFIVRSLFGGGTAWHEANHGAIRGRATVPAVPDDSDEEHVYIISYAEKMAQDIVPQLVKFESLFDSVWGASLGKKQDAATKKEVWGEAHQLWNFILTKWKNVQKLTQEQKEEYKGFTGVFFPEIEELAKFYTAGGHKGIVPPPWVLKAGEELPLVRTFIYHDGPKPVERKKDYYELAFDVRSSKFRTQRDVTGRPTRGTMRIRIVEDAPRATMQVRAYEGDVFAKNVRSWEYDLSKDKRGAYPFVAEVQVLQGKIEKDAALHLEVTYRDDPKAKSDQTTPTKKYDSATQQITVLGESDSKDIPPFDIELKSYLSDLYIRNLSKALLPLQVTEYIDQEQIRQQTVELQAEGPQSFLKLQPATWSDQEPLSSKTSHVIPRSDNNGRHVYRIRVENKAQSISSEKETEFEVKEKVLNVARVHQDAPMWCWAASLQSILNYKGLNLRACELVSMGKRLAKKGHFDCCNIDKTKLTTADEENCDLGSLPRWVPVTEIKESERLNYSKSMTEILREVDVEFDKVDGTMDSEDVMLTIINGNPFAILLNGHVSVGRGYRDIRDSSGKTLFYMHVMDPAIYPHYVLINHDAFVNKQSGSYFAALQWIGSLTNFRTTGPASEEAGIIALPEQAIQGIPFEARIEGLTEDDRTVEWFSPSKNTLKLSEQENGRAAEWIALSAGTTSIGARIYSDQEKKDLLTEKGPVDVRVLPTPFLELVLGTGTLKKVLGGGSILKEMLSAKGDDVILDLFQDDTLYKSKEAIDLVLSLKDKEQKDLSIDVARISLWPSWNYSKDGNVYLRSSQFLFDPNPVDQGSQADVLKGTYMAKFVPPQIPGEYVLWASLDGHDGKPLATSRKIKIIYHDQPRGEGLSLSKEKVSVDENTIATLQSGIETVADWNKKFDLKWEFTKGVKEGKGSSVSSKILSSTEPGTKTVTVQIISKDDGVEIARYSKTWEVMEPLKASVTIKGLPEAEPSKPVDFTTEVVADDAMKKSLQLEWRIESPKGMTQKGPKGDKIQLVFEEVGTYKVRVEAYSKVGDKEFKVAEDDHTIVVKKKPEEEKAEKEKAEKEKVAKEKAEKEKAEKEKIEGEKAEKERAEKEKAEKEKAGKEKGEPSGKLSFSGTAADIWEGGNTPEGFSLKRRNAKGGRTFELCPYPGEVWAEAWGKLEPSRSLRTREDMARRLNEEVEDHKRWGREGAIREIAVGDFKGLFLDTKVRFYYGAWAADAGFRACEIKAFGHGFVMKGERVVELGYYVSGAGCFDNSHRPFLESQGATAQSEAKAIMAGLRLVESGVISKVSYTGPKLDGSDLPQVVLVPSQIERLKVGDVVKVQAVVEKAKPEDSPFNYTWTGDFQGSGNAVTLKAAKPGKFTLTVSVDGARYNLGSASVEYEVADFKVKIERMPAGNQPVPVGGKVHLKATLTSDGRPASGDFIYRWQPHPEVSFLPFEGSSRDTDAVFTKLEKTKVWVQVLEQKGKILSTVAESDQIEIDVIQPKLKLVAEPTDPYVGKEVKVTVTEEPRMDDKTVDFWWEIAGNALNPGPLRDNRQYTFRPKDTTPITVTVHAKAKDGGADLGEQKITVTGKPYQVTARIIEKFPKPKVFDPARKDFVETPGGTFVIDEQVTAEAEVIGGPPRDEIRWNWVGNKGTSVSNPASSSPALSRHETGTAQATVTARDKDNVVLGSTTVSFSVTVSADEGKASASKEVAKKLAEARQLLSEGKIDKAIIAAEEAAKLDPKAAGPLLKELAQASKKWGWDAVNDREFDKAVKGLENAVRLDPSDQDAQEKLRKVKGWSDVWDRIVNQEVPEFDRLISEKKPFSAQKQLLKIQEMQKDMPGGGSSKVLQGITERFNRAMEEYRAFRQDVEKRYTEYFKEKNWEAGQSLMQESLKRELHVTDEKTNRERLAQCQQMLGEQRQVWDFYQRTKIDFEQGKVKDATKVVQELRDKTNVYGNNAPQRQQMLDLAKAIEKKFAEDREKTKAAMDAKKKSEDLLARGIEMQEQKRHKEAIASFTQAIELDPNNSEAYRRRGMSKRETKDYSGAMADFTRAIDLDPQNSRAYAGRGGARAGMDDVRGAIDDYTRAIELDSQYESAYFNRGFYRGKQGDHTGAVADYDHVIGINPKNSEAYNNRGSAKENLGDLRGALSDYEQALAINGSYERARRNAERVRALLAGGKTDTGTETGKSKGEGAVVGTVPSSNILTSKAWQFGRSDGTVLASKMRLLPDGQIEGATHSNESRWAIVGKELLFYDSAGKVSTRYNSFRQEGGRWVISGPFVLWGKITHVLKEVGDLTPPVISKGSDLSGTWKSTYTADQYEITQSGAQFTWVRKGTSETAKGTVDGNRLSVTWTGGPVGTGSATATVIVDASGRATEIRFSNGAVFTRLKEVGDLTPSVIPKGNDLRGTWTSSYTADQYEITQSGSQFTWVRKGTSETARGTVDGNRLSVTWTGGPVGTGSATATVIVDASGRATEIRFSNGAVFIRVR